MKLNHHAPAVPDYNLYALRTLSNPGSLPSFNVVRRCPFDGRISVRTVVLRHNRPFDGTGARFLSRLRAQKLTFLDAMHIS